SPRAAVLSLHHLSQVQAGILDFDAVAIESGFGKSVQFTGIQKCFAGDATNIETGSAQRRTLVDAGDLHAELGRADGCHVTAGTGTDDDKIETVGHQTSKNNRAGFSMHSLTRVKNNTASRPSIRR